MSVRVPENIIVIVKNYKWRFNRVWHRMLYSCTYMATVSGRQWVINGCWSVAQYEDRAVYFSQLWLVITMLYRVVCVTTAWNRSTRRGSSWLRVVGTIQRWVDTSKCVETRRQGAGWLATGLHVSPAFVSRYSLEGARVARLPSAVFMDFNRRRQIARLDYGSIRGGYKTACTRVQIYRTLADIPCRPGFVCATYIRYNRSSALQVYSQCALDSASSRPLHHGNEPLLRRLTNNRRSGFSIDVTSVSVTWIRYRLTLWSKHRPIVFL